MKNLLLCIVVVFALTSFAQDANITTFTEQLEAGDYGRVYCLLVSQHGELITEIYFHDYDGDSFFPVFSVTKSVTSAALGIAIDQKFISGVDARLGELLPDYDINAVKQNISLESLLTMSAGLEWNEAYTGGVSDVLALFGEQDWTAYVLNKDIIEDPGSNFNYNSGISVVVGEILEQAVGQSVEEFVAKNLFIPLGITEWDWETTGDGSSNTGWGLHLRPRDMLKFGELYLNEGRVGETQLIPAEWVAVSTQTQVEVDGMFTYGYQWWRLTEDYLTEHGTTLKDVYIAWGFGGQLIIIMPELDAVVVSTASNFISDESKVVEGVLEYVVPSLKN
jgi:CubicO group peptidase (beta-lactamase class C family)